MKNTKAITSLHKMLLSDSALTVSRSTSNVKTPTYSAIQNTEPTAYEICPHGVAHLSLVSTAGNALKK